MPKRTMREELEKLIDNALKQAEGLDIFTFAIYHDHESEFVSVCIDTKENSNRQVEEMNIYNMKHFRRVVSEGNLEEAALWQANVGRNLSLGDFQAVNIVECDIKNNQVNKSFYLGMVKAIENKSSAISQQSSHGNSLLFCCSTDAEEVGLTWAPSNA